MFKAIRIAILLFVLFFVAVNAWLIQVRSTDWDKSLWIKIYPINADGSDVAAQYIAGLEKREFEEIERFVAREVERHGRTLNQPVRVELGREVREQPPAIKPGSSRVDIIWWSLKMRWWSWSITDDRVDPDVQIFVRYHHPQQTLLLENSVGLQKGMVGIVNAYASRRHRGRNNLVITHEFLHTLGATDKYDPHDGQPIPPDGLGEPDREPMYPQRYTEIMGGRLAKSRLDSEIPRNLSKVLIGDLTAREINLVEDD
ncbi:MAG: hypothetical protein AAF351_03390 [Pseudomonadota bacterium]